MKPFPALEAKKIGGKVKNKMGASPEHWHTRARRSAAAIRGGILGRRSGGVAAAEAPRLKNANFAVHNKVYAGNYFGFP